LALHHIKKGLDIPIPGRPEQRVGTGPAVGHAAFLGADFPGLRPRVLVREGDTVRRGQALVEDRAMPGVTHTAPAAGTVAAVHRGPRRTLRSVVIRLSPSERRGEATAAECATFPAFPARRSGALAADGVRALLVESGLWTALRARPFGRVPSPASSPRAICVNAMDTEPLAADPEAAIREAPRDFEAGLRALAMLTDGTTYLCVAADSGIADGLDAPVSVERFRGPHPAGTAGLQLHVLAPVDRARPAWSIASGDVIAVGELLRTGILPVHRVVALAGPAVRHPRLVRSRLGASLDEQTRGELAEGEVRVVSGSLLSGRAVPSRDEAYLGRHHHQISALHEGRARRLLDWARPGRDRFSILPVFTSRLRGRPCTFTTSTHGTPGPILPLGLYERVLPMDIPATFLLRALAAGDLELAEQLGCLELLEEDLALASFVCPGKNDFGPLLRRALDRLEGD
jgi:Na+-transporting NADH:ubiquinone oxidoreductase subunit A